MLRHYSGTALPRDLLRARQLSLMTSAGVAHQANALAHVIQQADLHRDLDPAPLWPLPLLWALGKPAADKESHRLQFCAELPPLN
jgi:hypothetical protein